MKLACILMASGYSSRFGDNKLTVKYRGKTLFELAAESLPKEAFSDIVAVTQYEEIERMSKRYGFRCERNPMEDPAVSRTILLGLEAVERYGADACMFCVCDQPCRTKGSIQKLIACFQAQPEKIAALDYRGRRGNPVIFPSRYFAELKHLKGDRGGSAVMKRHPGEIVLSQAESELELMDVDTIEDLRRLPDDPVK